MSNIAQTQRRQSVYDASSEVLEAVVVENWGDPGLDEDFAFDILSRFVIVAIKSEYRVPTLDKWNGIFAVVARPRSLWVSAEGGRANSFSSQKRSDPLGNLSVGLAGSFTTNGIPRINEPYRVGETITIKKLRAPLKFQLENGDRIPKAIDPIFQSVFKLSSANNYYNYNSWHNVVASLPYFTSDPSRIDLFAQQCIHNPLFESDPFSFCISLYKYQYEAFMLTLAQNRTDLRAYLENMFSNQLAGDSGVYRANGGYVFGSGHPDYLDFMSIGYEDMNVGNKARTANSDCIPLIVTVPSQFPTPKNRAIGTISYNPTYSTIVKSN
jgi:hypothetical protein